MSEPKKFWESKTLWVNLIAAVAVVIQTQTGFVVGPELQALGLTVINLGLRAITEKPLEW